MNMYKSSCESIEAYLNGGAVENNENGTGQRNDECSVCREEERCVLSPNRVLLKCGAPLSTSIPAATEAGATFNVANLNVDTSKYHDPCIRFEFAGNILTTPGTVTLNFQIFKQCKYQAAAFPVGPVWTFSRLGATAGENNVFDFSVCSCDTCENECCNYSVVVTVETLDADSAVVISNAALSALVVDNPHC